MRKSQKLAAGMMLVTATGLGAGALVWSSRSPSVDSPRAPVSAVGTAAAPTAKQQVTPAPSWRAGEARLYKLALSINSTIGGAPVIGLEIAGAWSLVALGHDDGAMLIRGELRELDVKSSTQTAGGVDVDDLRENLSTAHYFTSDPEGQVKSVRVPEDLWSAPQNILRSLPSMFQFSRPTWPPPAKWSSSEQDITGRYVAQYERDPRQDGFIKHKERYVEVLGASQSGMSIRGARHEIPTSTVTYQFSPEEILQELSFNERIEVKSDMLPPMITETSLTLSLMHVSDASKLVAGWLQAAEQLSDRAPHDLIGTAGRRRPELEKARIAGRDLRGMLASLAGASAMHQDEKKQETERFRTFGALSALLRTDDKAAIEAAQYIRKAGKEKDIVMDALGSSGTPAAQSALVDLLDDRALGGADRERAVRALSMTEEPTRETVSSLVGLLTDSHVSGHAKMALGSLVHDLQAPDPVLAKMANDQLLAQLRRDEGTTAMNTDLLALGNAGHPDSIQAITPLLQHPSAEIRASAVQSLRRIPGEEADRLIAAKLRADPERGVRRSAADAARGRSPSPSLLDALGASVRLDTDVNTRLECLRTIGTWPPSLPAVIGALHWVSNNDASDDLKAIARTYLSRFALP